LLRQDNADLRLTEKGYKIGLADHDRYNRVVQKIEEISKVETFLNKLSISPESVNPHLESMGSAPIKQKLKASTLISRPQITIDGIRKYEAEIDKILSKYDNEVVEQVEINIKYEGYIQRERDVVEKMERLENVKLHPNFDYKKVTSLSAEARDKLTKIKPQTLGQASRISGVSPADVSILMLSIGR
jgi:tRNA uridine 5-carboxymethylaminomethyl modification enzyme